MKILSPYVHFLKTEEKHYIILDTYNGKIYRVHEKDAGIFETAVQAPEKLNEQHVLVKNNIVIENDVYESHENLYEEFQNKTDYLHLVLMPTEDCNFRCSYCYENHFKSTMNKEVIDSIYKFLEKHLCEYDALRIEWFGGEPLFAYEKVLEISYKMKDICKKYKKPYYASMTTNGYFLNLDTFNKLRKCGILRYQITIDGLERDHDKQRFLADGSGTFSQIINNLKEIRDNVKSSLFAITIRSNITEQNYEHFAEFLDFIDKEFGKDPRFNYLWKIAWNPNAEECSSYLPQETLRGLLQESAKRKLNLENSRQQMTKYGNICYASNKNSYIIGADARLYKCTVSFDKEENQIGRLLSNGEMEIDSKKLQFWTQRKKCYKQSMCEKCYLFPSCMGIYCNLNNVDTKGNFVCGGYKQYVDDYLRCIDTCNIYVTDLELT